MTIIVGVNIWFTFKLHLDKKLDTIVSEPKTNIYTGLILILLYYPSQLSYS